MPGSQKMDLDSEDASTSHADGSAEFSKVNDVDDLERVRAFMMDGWTNSSPPKFVSLEDIKKATHGLQNMALAHEVAVDGNFRIERFEPEDDTLEKTVKDMLHKAFWDILRNELTSQPPIYAQALALLKEIKETLYELLQPEFIAAKNSAFKDRINEVLDIDLIKQQLEKGELVFEPYAQFVVSIMAKICAPVRDEEIKKLSECTDVVEMFRGIMETLKLMKLDIANFTLRMLRPNIVATSIEYEKSKFADFLKIQSDGLQYTRRWLLKHLTQEKMSELTQDENAIRQLTSSLVLESYLDLLEFDNCPLAETLMLDQTRFIELRNKNTRLVVAACVLLLVKPLLDRSKVETGIDQMCKLKEQILALLEPVSSNKELENTTPNVLIHIKEYIKKLEQETPKVKDFPGYSDLMSVLDKSIIDLYKPDLPIRELMTNRVRQFLKNLIMTQTIQVTSGILPVQKELTTVAAKFSLLINHNKNVFEEYYYDIVTKAVADRNIPN